MDIKKETSYVRMHFNCMSKSRCLIIYFIGTLLFKQRAVAYEFRND